MNGFLEKQTNEHKKRIMSQKDREEKHPITLMRTIHKKIKMIKSQNKIYDDTERHIIMHQSLNLHSLILILRSPS